MTVIVTTPNSVIEREILRCFSNYTTKLIRSKISNIKDEVEDIVQYSLRASQEYMELLGGTLKKDFGLPDSDAARMVNEIIDTIAANIEVKYINNYFGGLSIGILRDGFKDILNLSSSVVDTNKGQQLPWLEWLLLQGDNIIVSDFVVKYGPSPFSRSGDALMIESIGGFWKVDSRFSGTPTDNWLTRTLSTIEPAIFNVVKKHLQ